MLDRPSNLTETWTDERIETMRAMLADGHSYGEIAAALGKPITRNSCIGKAKRLRMTQAKRAKSLPPKAAGNRGGIPPKKRTPDQVTEDHRVRSTIIAKVNRKHERKSAAVVHGVLTRPDLPTVEPFIPEDGVDVTHLLGILQLNQHTCKWPVGDPLLPGFGFCGEHTREGSVYCSTHHRKAYVSI